MLLDILYTHTTNVRDVLSFQFYMHENGRYTYLINRKNFCFFLFAKIILEFTNYNFKILMSLE